MNQLPLIAPCRGEPEPVDGYYLETVGPDVVRLPYLASIVSQIKHQLTDGPKGYIELQQQTGIDSDALVRHLWMLQGTGQIHIHTARHEGRYELVSA